MRKFTLKSMLVAIAFIMAGMQTSNAQETMPEATLDYPAGLYSSFPPSSVSITWGNRPIELVDPSTDEMGDEYVTAYVKLGDQEELPVNAYVMSSFGNPEDPDDPDIWQLDIALYDLDDLWAFDGNTITVIIPQGIVRDAAGSINLAQEFVFKIVPTYTEYSVSPETGGTLTDELKVKVSFDGYPIEYLQSEIRAMSYEPEFRDIALALGNEVKINDNNEIEIDLSGLSDGYYELVVPEGFVMITIGGEKYLSPDIWLEYTLESDSNGINSAVVQGVSNIYTICGRKVLESNDKERLGRGIYIIDGKKIFIK